MSNITTLGELAARLQARGFPTTRHTLRKGCKWYQIPIDVEDTAHRAKRYIIFTRDARRLEQIHTGVIIGNGEQL